MDAPADKTTPSSQRLDESTLISLSHLSELDLSGHWREVVDTRKSDVLSLPGQEREEIRQASKIESLLIFNESEGYTFGHTHYTIKRICKENKEDLNVSVIYSLHFIVFNAYTKYYENNLYVYISVL